MTLIYMPAQASTASCCVDLLMKHGKYSNLAMEFAAAVIVVMKKCHNEESNRLCIEQCTAFLGESQTQIVDNFTRLLHQGMIIQDTSSKGVNILLSSNLTASPLSSTKQNFTFWPE